MNRLYRSLLLTGIVAAGLAGCGDDVTVVDPPPPPPPPPPQVRSVTVTPDNITVNPGQTVQMFASVTADAGATVTVTWSSSDETRATVNGSGLVTVLANAPTGSVAIRATATDGDGGTASDAATLNVAVPTPATVSIQEVTFTNGAGQQVPVILTNVFGQIEVTLNVDNGSKTLERVDALIGGTVVASQSFSTTSPAPQPSAAGAPVVLSLSVNTAQLRQNGGIFVPVIYNGNSAITANLYVVGEATPLASNAIPVVMNNPDALVRTSSASLAPTALTPTFNDGTNDWYTGSQTVDGFHYVAFGKVVPATVALGSTFCGNSNNLVPAGATATSGIGLTGTYDCAGLEGSNSVDGTIVTTFAAGAVGPDGTALVAPTSFSTVGSSFVVPVNDNRWNMINPAVGTNPGPVFVDNLGPTITPDEIGFAAGCSGTIPAPGCWINRAYSLVGDFPAVDGGSGVATVEVFDLAGTAPVACGTTAFDPSSATSMPEQTSPTAYDACGIATDNVGNPSAPVQGFNVFSLDATGPTIVYAASATYTPNMTLTNAIPAQTLDWEVQDNNSGLEQATSFGLAFTYLVNNAGVAVTELTPGPCVLPSTVLTGAGTAPLQLQTPFAPDAACALPGYYYYTASVTDRAGNTTTDTDVQQFAFEPGTGVVNFVNLNPFYGGGDPAGVTVFAGHTGADLANARVGVTYTTSGGNPAEFRFRFDGVFGTAWDNALYLATPAAGETLTIPGSQVLAAVQDGAAPVAPAGATASINQFNVEVQDVFGLWSGIFNSPVAAALKNTNFTTENVWATPNIGTPTFAAAGNCTFEYSTPTNGPTIPARVWVVDNNGGGGIYDVILEITAAPTLVSDNGIQRLYRYTVHATDDCASLTQAANLAHLQLVAIKNSTDANLGAVGVPVGYLVP